MAQTVRRSVRPYYGVAVLWVVYSLLFPLYRFGHFVLAGLLSLIVFFLLRAISKDVVEETPEVKKEEKPKEESTGNEALDKLLKEGQMAISEMERLDEAIQDEKISQDIRKLQDICEKIFAQAKADPSKVPQLHKFMGYYLPTTLKLLNSYDRMGSQGVSGENISGTLHKVEGMMDTIVQAFEKQLDSLFGSEAMDISTDITVLENMMAREGLTADALHTAATGDTATATQTQQEGEGSTITLKL